MKNFLLVLLTIPSIFLYSQQHIKLASDIYPPFTDVDSEKGFALELVKEALKRGDVQTEQTITGFSKVMDGINTGIYDGSAALWKTEDRENYLLYSEPYLENRLVLVGRKGSDVSAKSLSELKDKRIAIISGYAYGTSVYTSLDVIIIPGKSHQENLEKLLTFKTDYMLVDELLISYLLNYQMNDISRFLEIGKEAFMVQPLHLAILKDKPDTRKIIEDFNSNIKNMMADGTYNKILELNWIQSDVDGDGVHELVLLGDKAGTEAPANYYRLMTKTAMTENSERYYINGEVYEGWQVVPARYKTDIIKAANMNTTSTSGLKLKF
ncbi:substrate-binding periplasmic protein [Eudoraea adriatica]|uniref:substrate-binding periplasmic protein n=1 Tax=Eudoraea adriatica TaxID=446681 RepID=UPI00037FCD72|nr:transporter substrate-binding domain-containing protein [Eudoraea adriatica]